MFGHSMPFARFRRFLGGRRGAAAVEYALIAPSLMLVVLGVMEVGMYAWNQHTIEHATEETARVVMTKTAVANEQVAADLKARMPGLAGEQLVAHVSQETIGATTFVTLDVNYTYSFFLIGGFIGYDTIVIASKSRVPLRSTQ